MSVSSLTSFNRLTSRRRFVTSLWRLLPALSLFTLMFLAASPKHAGSLADIWPPLVLPALFYWGLMRPDSLRFPLVCIAGLLQDALMSTPFGSSALLWMLFRYVVMTRRKSLADEGFMVHWIAYSIMLMVTLALEWAIVGLDAGHAMPVGAPLMQCVLGVLAYPAMHAILSSIEHWFYRRYWYILQAV